eukprot:TRINITY_DN6209_c0_g1_i2.p1 TRINITY_DN6209_c0_g1~~TRINITY_DN6209_c0_g1_i2.p1  ORF type:complete len:651 (-),score=74.18 TRINITY_DN6209_c0_g1_i2:331-2283(-)
MKKKKELEWTTITDSGPFPGVLFAQTANTINDKIWFFGGYGGQYSNSVFTFDLQNKKWNHEIVKGFVPSKRCAHTTSTIGTKLYIYGGFDGAKQLNDFYVLDTETLTFKKIELSLSIPHCYHCAAVIGRTKIYIFGGWDGKVRSNSIFLIDLEKEAGGEMLRLQKIENRGSYPSERSACSASVIGNKIYIFGGTLDGKVMSDQLFVFDTGLCEWQKIEGKITPGPSAYHCAVVINDKIFVFGGFRTTKRLKDVWVFDSETKEWTCPAVKGTSPSPRSHCSASVYNNQIYIYGGYDGKLLFKDFFLLDPKELSAPLINSLAQDYETLLDNADFVDFILNFKGTEFSLHKPVILARCPSLLEIEALEEKLPISVDTFKLFINFLYSDRIPDILKPEQLLELLQCSHYFNKKILRMICADLLETEIRHSNIKEWEDIAVGLKSPFLSRLLQFYSHKDMDSTVSEFWKTEDEIRNPSSSTSTSTSTSTSLPVVKTSTLSEDEFFILEVEKNQIQMYQEEFNKLFLQQKGDFDILIEDKKIPCYKAILAARNQYFAGLLRSGMAETKKGEIRLPGPENLDVGLTYRTLSKLVQYLYSNSTAHISSEEDCRSILRVADYYGLSSDFCSQHLSLMEHCMSISKYRGKNRTDRSCSIM